MSKILKKLWLILSLLLAVVVPLVAHPIIYLPDWFGVVVGIIFLIIGGFFYTLILSASWKFKFLRYTILLFTFISLLFIGRTE